MSVLFIRVSFCVYTICVVVFACVCMFIFVFMHFYFCMRVFVYVYACLFCLCVFLFMFMRVYFVYAYSASCVVVKKSERPPNASFVDSLACLVYSVFLQKKSGVTGYGLPGK